jgi:hypothetical protein
MILRVKPFRSRAQLAQYKVIQLKAAFVFVDDDTRSLN